MAKQKPSVMSEAKMESLLAIKIETGPSESNRPTSQVSRSVSNRDLLTVETNPVIDMRKARPLSRLYSEHNLHERNFNAITPKILKNIQEAKHP